MRLCVTGTCSQGKSTFIKDFLKEWPIYKTPKKTYRDSLGDEWGMKTTKDVQWDILNSMVDEHQRHDKDDNVIYDRGVLDNIASTLWAYSNKVDGVDDEFVEKCISVVRETLKLVDIVFYIPLTKVAKLEYDTEEFLANKEKGLVDENYRVEIDNILKAVKRDWDVNHDSKFFDPRDKPAIIELFGYPEERLQMAKLYIDAEGNAIDDSSSLMSESELNEIEIMKDKLGVSDSQSQAFKNPKGYQ
jgi:hypothetical protein